MLGEGLRVANRGETAGREWSVRLDGRDGGETVETWAGCDTGRGRTESCAQQTLGEDQVDSSRPCLNMASFKSSVDREISDRCGNVARTFPSPQKVGARPVRLSPVGDLLTGGDSHLGDPP